MKTVTIAISGMHCGGCVKSVSRVLSELEGVQSVDVSLEQARAEITFDDSKIQPAVFVETIEDAGFDATL